MGSLTATEVKAKRAAKVPGRYGDGDGLALLIGKSGSASWMVRVQKDGKRRDIGLGSAAKVSLALARDRAEKVRSQIEAGIDPIAERRKAAGVPTFREAAALVHAEHVKGWKGERAASTARNGWRPLRPMPSRRLGTYRLGRWMRQPCATPLRRFG